MPNFLRHFWHSAKSVVSPSSLERNDRSSTNYSNLSSAKHKADSRSQPIVVKQLAAFHLDTLTSSNGTSPSDTKYSTSRPDLPEEKDNAFVDTEAVAIELVLRQKGAAYRTEIVSPAVVGNGSSVDGINSHFNLPVPPLAHAQEDAGKATTGGREFDMSKEPGQRIVRTDQVDVERSLA